jgi:hypothetical protein
MKIKYTKYKTILVHVLCGRESRSVTLREEHRFESRVLTRIFGRKREEVIGA